MKSPIGNTVFRIAKEIPVKSGFPTRSAMRGLIRSFTSAVTTVPKAAPITTPTARSTTLPRRMNCLKPDNMKSPPPIDWPQNVYAERSRVKVQITGVDSGKVQTFAPTDLAGGLTSKVSDPHRHHDIPVLVILGFRWTQLSGRLCILQFQFYVARPGRFDEVHQVLRVESDRHRLAVIGDFEGILRFAGLGGRCGELQLVLLQTQPHGARPLIGELGDARNRRSQFLAVQGDGL